MKSSINQNPLITPVNILSSGVYGFKSRSTRLQNGDGGGDEQGMKVGMLKHIVENRK